MFFRDNGHILDASGDYVECMECGASFDADNRDDAISMRVERCMAAPARFVAEGCLVIDTDSNSVVGVASSDTEAEEVAEDESTRLLMFGDTDMS